MFLIILFSCTAWFSLSALVGKAPGKSKKSDPNDHHMMLFGFERALLILNSPKSISLNKPALDLLCESILSPLTQYKCFLQANINHSVGVFAYEHGDNDRAAGYLDKSSRFRRQMLDDLRGQACENSTNSGNDLSKLFNAVVGGMKSNYLVSPASMSEDRFEDIFTYSITHTCIQLPVRKGLAVDELELSLSLTLEYSALTQHADQKYQMALSLFQESLILRTIHVGKHSLDVASLHFNMGQSFIMSILLRFHILCLTHIFLNVICPMSQGLSTMILNSMIKPLAVITRVFGYGLIK